MSRCPARHLTSLALLTLALVADFISSPCRTGDPATVTGTVTDQQGAVVPGVVVTARNIDTNVDTQAVTESDGGFTIRQLIPGRYKVTATLQGFKTFTRDGITLRTAETATLRISLTLGGVEETVVVTSGLTQVESNETAISQTIENKRITELPLNGRQVYMLLQLTAGHALHADDVRRDRLLRHARLGRQRVARRSTGSRTGNNEFLIEGAPSSGTGGGTGNWNYAPPVDAIEEFKVQTSSTDASYGRTSGGVVNMTLRSGTNKLHGSAHSCSTAGRGSTRTRSRTSATTSRTRGTSTTTARRMDERPAPPQEDVLHGRLSGLLREHPVPGHAHDPDRSAAAR